jgi:putative copper export protein
VATVGVRDGRAVLPVRLLPGRPAAVAVDLRSVKSAPTVVLRWNAVASDGHQTSGSLVLHVRGPGAAASPVVGNQQPPLLRPAEVGARVGGYLALAVLVGGLLFVSFLWPAGAAEARTRFVLSASVAVGACAAVADLAIDLWRADGAMSLHTALTEPFGRSYAALVLLWLLAAVVVVAVLQGGESGVRRLAWRVGALVVAVGLIRVTSMNAHAGQGTGASWGEVADILHLVGVSCWVGGLVVLTVGVLPRRRLEELEVVVPRFSKVALLSVLLIVGSGVVLVRQLIWPLDGIWTTHYGRVLAVKLSIFLLVMAAAMVSKRWVDRTVAQRGATRRGSTAVRSIATSVAAETVLVTAVLGAASVLATSSPGI